MSSRPPRPRQVRGTGAGCPPGRSPQGGGKCPDDPRPAGRHDMLHLHGFKDGDGRALPHRVAGRDLEADEATPERGRNGLRSGRARDRGGPAAFEGRERSGLVHPGLSGGLRYEPSRAALHPARIEGRGADLGVTSQRAQEREVRPDPDDPELGERPAGPSERLGKAGRGKGHDLGEERVEGGGGRVARRPECLDPDTGPARRVEGRERAAGRQRRPVRCTRSMLTRNSTAKPRGRPRASCVRPSSGSVAPEAMRNCVATRSTPMTSSVTDARPAGAGSPP
jgi:hypothetical protein